MRVAACLPLELVKAQRPRVVLVKGAHHAVHLWLRAVRAWRDWSRARAASSRVLSRCTSRSLSSPGSAAARSMQLPALALLACGPTWWRTVCVTSAHRHEVKAQVAHRQRPLQLPGVQLAAAVHVYAVVPLRSPCERATVRCGMLSSADGARARAATDSGAFNASKTGSGSAPGRAATCMLVAPWSMLLWHPVYYLCLPRNTPAAAGPPCCWTARGADHAGSRILPRSMRNCVITGIKYMYADLRAALTGSGVVAMRARVSPRPAAGPGLGRWPRPARCKAW